MKEKRTFQRQYANADEKEAEEYLAKVQLDDGTIVMGRLLESKKIKKQCKSLKEIKNSRIKLERLGETVQAQNGQLMKIISYRSALDMDVQFEDGTIVRSCPYRTFKNGKLTNPSLRKLPQKVDIRAKRIGENSVNKSGEKMTIIAYRGCDDLDVQFEDGTVVTGRRYDNFKNGHIKKTKNVGNARAKKEMRLGEEKMTKNGQLMKIIAYRNSSSIDVQFSDGTVVTERSYEAFQLEQIRNPNLQASHPSCKKKRKTERIGEERVMRNGLKATIIEYKGSNNMIVRFEDGFVKETTYSNFKNGRVANAETPDYYKEDQSGKRIGEYRIMLNGMGCTIIEYESVRNIRVRFDDGYETQSRYYEFCKCSIANPRIKDYPIYRKGETRIMKDNIKATIIEYKNHNDVEIEFGDGSRKKCTYYAFKNGLVSSPNRLVGQTLTMNNGRLATIIRYQNYNNVDVTFGNGRTVRTTMERLRRGSMKGSYNRVGEKATMKNGMEAEIVGIRDSYNKIVVRFEDGYERKTTYTSFVKGRVPYPKYVSKCKAV